MIGVFKARGDGSGPLQLIKVGRALLNSAGVDFRTYKKTSDASARQQNIFHCLMAVLYHNGRKTGPGHRFSIGRRQILPHGLRATTMNSPMRSPSQPTTSTTHRHLTLHQGRQWVS